MKIAVQEVDSSGNSTWVNLDHIISQDIADLWASGAFIASDLAEHRGKATTLKFNHADAVFVRITLKRLPLKVAMEADFTQSYATVAAHSEDEKSEGELLLAFELPTPITDAKVFARLLAGIETIYAGSTHHTNAEQAYGLKAGSGQSSLLGKKLDVNAVHHLERLGKESNELKKGHGAYLRSHVTLDRSTVLSLPNREDFMLEQLPKDVEVFCPIHTDIVPTGVVHWYADGTPGVQCTHCKRTYAAPTTQRNYDFGFFDRTVKSLAAEQKTLTIVSGGLELGDSDVTNLKEEYLPSLPLEAGVTFVKSPKGTGKTEVLVKLVEQCKKQNLRVLLLGHRRALIQSISVRLGLDCYFVLDDEPATSAKTNEVTDDLLDFGTPEEDAPVPDPIVSEDKDKDQTSYQHVTPTKHYAICLDSMQVLDPQDEKRQYDVVIIDEAEQVFSHLTGETLKGRRREVFARLSYYLRVAPSVYLLDADLNMVTMTTAFEVFKPDKPARFIINEPTSKQCDIHLYSNRGQLAKLLIDSVGAGKKVFVSTNSKRKAVDLKILVLKFHPTTRVAVVTSDNSQQREVQTLLGDIANRFEHDLDVLIASPAIGTGIDITFKDSDDKPRKVVDCVFGMFEANIVTHFDIDQQLMRVRHPGEVHVWVDTKPMNYETDVGCIKRELHKSVRKTDYLLGYEDDGKPITAGDRGLVNIWAQVLAASRGSKNRLADLFRSLRIDGGWNIIDVEYDSGASAFGKAGLAGAKVTRLAIRKANLLAAEVLRYDDAAKLQERDKQGLPLTDKERDALDRYNIENFYAENQITSDLIDFDDEGRTRECVMRLECLISKREWLENRDAREVESGVVAFDRRRYLPQREVLEALFAASGLFDAATRKFKTDVSVNAGTLKSFLHALEAQRRQVETLFGMPIYVDCWSKPVVQLKGVLRLVGLDLENTETKQEGGKKTRNYSIPSDMLAAMVNAVKKRDEQFKRDAEERQHSAKDKLVHDCANKMAGSVSSEKKQGVVDAFRKRAGE